ncbi:TetR/AcrR family transcriptional regulator [Flindersiella endophytica]
MRPADDLTAKARIRDAALEHFAEHGSKGATMRAIADRAGVSLGLVQHHFGSKAGLLDACDAYVLAFVRKQITLAVDEQQLSEPAYVAEAHQLAPPVLRYLGRALADGTPGAAALYDELVTTTESFLAEHTPSADPRGEAAVFVAMRLGVYVLHEHLSRAFGADAFSPGSLPRIGSALLSIVSPDLFGADLTSQARTGLERHGKGEGTNR